MTKKPRATHEEIAREIPFPDALLPFFADEEEAVSAKGLWLGTWLTQAEKLWIKEQTPCAELAGILGSFGLSVDDSADAFDQLIEAEKANETLDLDNAEAYEAVAGASDTLEEASALIKELQEKIDDQDEPWRG